MMQRSQQWVFSACILAAACVPDDLEPQASATEGTSSESTSVSSGPATSADEPTGSTSGALTSGENTSSPSSSGTQPEDSGPDSDTGGTSGVSDTTSSTSGSGESICGDGMLDIDEECDDGKANGDNAACKSDCTLAFCGDEETQLGKESCDDGEKNGDGSYGGCTDLCQLGPHCGDKIHQPAHEECDAMDPELEDGSKCVGCVWNANLVFVSSEFYTGALGGVAGADDLCQELAEAAMLPSAGRFRAWLSDGVSSPQTRFGPPLEGAFILPNGAEIASSWADLVGNADLKSSINVDELKVPASKPHRAWSNTGSSGHSLESFDCDGWTVSDDSAKGSYGRTTAQDEGWTNSSNERCYESKHLYCIATAI